MTILVNSDIDVYIGAKIRTRRHFLGLSQTDLADKIGVTFQQIQKYEKGQNKVMASRIFELGQIMDVDVSYFFEDCYKYLKSTENVTALQEEQAEFLYDEEGGDHNNLEKESIKLLKAFNKINNKDARKKLLIFIKSLTD